ncbi:hypothetical protein TPHA_0O01460 [Tetrapisispora phaffii CBS 4417]|uniref:Nucleoporin Nup82 n=1 Tax=Tetrapisispora phaffii (strain ATCC 24235 / CBS 4417 / NBRC 1672 / NRRL Y-8282 / UCD 70-5) TaxID=1071381 RepID=G8C1T5_TETPH|nr:hypothetical protein TPHA_0O01460 [Tetrapisispora phaffii CBS 4417]CCE66113.1 hypothetical protein TPHA_0O01460 [Tetrapisispora phaffii CBS 4417]
MVSPQLHTIFNRFSVGKVSSKRSSITVDNGLKIILYQNNTVRYGFVNDADGNFKSITLEKEMIGDVSIIADQIGNYLCLFNEFEIRVIELPWKLWDAKEDSSFQLDNMVQIRSYDLKSFGTTIQKILFHPLGLAYPCLVVLLKNSNICSIDIKRILKVEEIPSTCITTFHTKGVMGLSSCIDDIIDISFSSDKLSLYALTETDIYLFYPFLIPTISVTKNEIDQLFQKSIILFENLENDSSEAVRRNIIKQLQLLSTLSGDIKTQMKQVKNTDETKIYNIDINTEYRSVNAQGSFSIAPFPEELYKQSAVNLSVIQIGHGNELYVITYDDGTVLILYRDLESSMSWDSNDYTFNNSFILLEKLKFNPDETKSILDIPFKNGIFAIAGDQTVNLIDTSCWSDILSQCIKDNDIRNLAGLSIESHKQTINTLEEPNSCILWNEHNKKELLFITETKLISSDILESNNESAEKLPVPAINDIKKIEKLQLKNYSQPIKEINIAVQRYKDSCKVPYSKVIPANIRQKPFANDENEDQLAYITEISQEIGSKILQGQTIALMMHTRLREQQDVFAEQLMHTNKELLHNKTIKQTYDIQSTKIKHITERNTKLNERTSKLIEMMEKIKQSQQYKNMPINDSESKLFKEIKKQVLIFNDAVNRQQEQQEAIKFLQTELNNIIEQPAQSHDAIIDSDEDEWNELCDLLNRDAKIIEDCNAELSSASGLI